MRSSWASIPVRRTIPGATSWRLSRVGISKQHEANDPLPRPVALIIGAAARKRPHWRRRHSTPPYTWTGGDGRWSDPYHWTDRQGPIVCLVRTMSPGSLRSTAITVEITQGCRMP
jgi:hypothetical protein